MTPVQFVWITAQLALLMLVVHLYKIEEPAGFTRLIPLLLGGFVVHAMLPRSLRLPAFVLLSLASICLLLGLKHGLGLIGLGLGLIVTCHLPLPFSLRVALIVAAGAGLALLRGEWVTPPVWGDMPTLVLPVLASMFMFRLMVYLYDVRTEKTPASWWERLAYFFMLPNVCFPLFPVVDYKNFRRTYYDKDAHEIYQKGVFWIFRGLTHLLAYRIVYFYLVLPAAEVVSPSLLVQYMITTYLLYLRVSGSFHLIVGILGLFGFNLPRTNQLYLLASSFNDYWRRINIYWKDFMLKMFFRPSFMKLKGLGTIPALTLASIVVFLATWLLHSYQWFWLRGSFPITGPDIGFWGMLGVCMAINTVWDAKRGTPRTLGKKKFLLGPAFGRSLRTVGMLAFICAMWSLWSATTVAEYVTLVRSGASGSVAEWGLVLLGALGLVVLGVAFQYANAHDWWFPAGFTHKRRLVAATVGGALALLAFSTPAVQQSFDEENAAVLASLMQTGFNRGDQDLMDRGYYETLLGGNQLTSELWRVRQKKPKDWLPVPETDLVWHREDILNFELFKNMDKTWKRARILTNSEGMRDREYSREKPPGTFRIAMVGASYTFGTGVQNDEVFEVLVEEWLNRDDPSETYERYEILNFSVPGYSVLQNLFLLEDRVLDFEPDLLLYTFHATEDRRLRGNLNRMITREREIPYGFVREEVAKAEVTADLPEIEMYRLLGPHLNPIVEWGFHAIADVCREKRLPMAAVYIPILPEMEEISENYEFYMEATRSAGFTTFAIMDIYGQQDMESLMIAPWDTHPNATGHRLIAEGLYDAVLEEGLLDLAPPPIPELAEAAEAGSD